MRKRSLKWFVILSEQNGMKLVRSLMLAAALAPMPAAASPFTGLYVLGDSLSDQGNLYIATGTIGPTLTPPQPPQPEPLHYYNGRFSNGPVYTEQLARNLGVTISPSLTGGTNFAFGGARTDYNTVEKPPAGTQVFPIGAAPWSLNAEVGAFNARVAAQGADPNALYVVFSGSNDITDIVARRLDPATTIAKTVAGVINAVEAFKAAGAQTILVPNLPNLGVVPRVTQLGPRVAALATSLITQYNAALSEALSGVTGVRIVQFDMFDFLDNVVADPTAYGFTNSTAACYSGFVTFDPNATVCNDPNDYVFWDVEHPTTAFHTLLGNAMFEAVVPEPGSLGLLGLGVAMLAGFGSRRKAED
jgi:phospholipase/lecithinase/hemolysin